MNKFKLSKYVLRDLIVSDSNYISLFNLINKTHILLPVEELKNENFTDLPNNLSKKAFNILKNNNFLVLKSIDENEALIKNAIYTSKEEGNGIYFHIYLTLDCNMNCIYCFENKEVINVKTISDEVEGKLLKFIEKKLKNNQFEFLEVIWFGGEPLLEIDKMLKLNTSLKKIVAKYAVNYSSQISTNGYYLDKLTIDIIKNLKLTNMTISIDGLKEVHNMRRPHKSSSEVDVYTRIIENIFYMNSVLIENKSDCNITINFIIDMNNYESILEVIKFLKNKDFFLKNKFIISFETTKDGKYVLKVEEIKYLANIFYKYILKSDLENQMINFFPSNLNVNCAGQLKNAFYVRTDGLIYKCIHDVTQIKNNQVFNLLTNEEFHFRSQELNQQLEKINDMVCKTCEILPICFGGCPAINIKNKYTSSNCSIWKYYLTDIISMKSKKMIGGIL